MYLARLDNDIIFKKVFTNKVIFTQFIKDILGIEIEVAKIETDKRFNPKIAYINFSYDIFAESTDKRIIIEIQRVNYDYNFDRFLHYHMMAIAELQRSAKDYKIKQTVYTIVIITAPDLIRDLHHQAVTKDVLISDFNPKALDGETFRFCQHQLLFLNPHYRNEHTVSSYRDWFELITESIYHPDNPQLNLQNAVIKQAALLIEDDNLSPEERESAKITAAQEETLRLYEQKGKEEGWRAGRLEGRLEIAKNLKAKGLEIAIIAEVTGLPSEVIKQLE